LQLLHPARIVTKSSAARMAKLVVLPNCRMASASAHPGEQHRLAATNSIPSTRRLTASNYEGIYPAMMGKTCNGMLKLYYLLVYFRRTRTKYVRLLR
jgi:hypothetical protein